MPFTNEIKNSSTFTNESNVNVGPAAKYGTAKFGKSKYGKPSTQDIQTFTKETKNSSSFTNETKNP